MLYCSSVLDGDGSHIVPLNMWDLIVYIVKKNCWPGSNCATWNIHDMKGGTSNLWEQSFWARLRVHTSRAWSILFLADSKSPLITKQNVLWNGSWCSNKLYNTSVQHGNTFYSESSTVCSNLFITYNLFSSRGYKNTLWQSFQRNFSIWTLSQPCQTDRLPNNTHQTKSRLPQSMNWSGLVGTTHQL